MVNVNSGSLFNWVAYLGANYPQVANITNSSLIAVNGAAGRTTTFAGTTIHVAFLGPGTLINGSVTFAGLDFADAQSKLSLTPSSVGGRGYLYAYYNG